MTLLLAFTLLSPCAAGTDTPGLNRLAIAIDQAPEMVRMDFAATALAEMSAAHTAEADRARAEARHNARDRDLASWAHATADYARQLVLLADSLATAGSVAPAGRVTISA